MRALFTRPDRTAIIALLVGLLLRLSMLAFVNVRVENDAATYDITAMNIVEHGTVSMSQAPPIEPTMYRPPLYPAFLAACYGVAGHHLFAVQLAQMLLSLLAGWLLSRAVEHAQPGLGNWALWATCLSPFESVYSVVLLSEGLASFLLAAAFASWMVLGERSRWIAMGVCLGLATLTRDIYIALAPFVALVWTIWGTGTLRDRMSRGVVVVVVALAVVAPWTARNYGHSGRLVPVSAGRLGLSLWMGAWSTTAGSIGPEVDGERVWPDSAFERPEDRARIEALAGDLPAQDRVYREMFVSRISREPHLVLGRWLVRVPLLWLGTRFDIFELRPSVFPYGSAQWTLAKLALYALNASVALMGLVGAVLALRKRHPLRWLGVPLLFTVLVYLPLNSFENRYSQPMLPFVAALASFAASRAVARWRARRASSTSAGTGSTTRQSEATVS